MPTSEEKELFAKAIQLIVGKYDYNYLEAILHYCEEADMEMESAILLIDDRLKALIAQNAEDLHLLPRFGRLPL